ncbi:polysaccharide deacetylase family protein [Thermoproteota archaeon]
MRYKTLLISAAISAAFIVVFTLFILLFSTQTPEIVLLSFDVEPVDGDKNVVAVLDMLNSTDTKATFFFTGMYAEKYPEIIRQTNEQGHEIACHGYSHKRFTKMNDSEKKDEIKRCKKIISDITNTTPEGFRAPYNRIDKETYYILGEEFHYDATQISGSVLIYPEPNMPEVKISSLFMIPAEDVIWLHYLHIPDSAYFYLLRHKCCTVSYIFHPHHISAPGRLERLERLITGLKARNTRFIKHFDFILLQNDNN